MKRLIALILAALLLTACAGEKAPEPTLPPETTAPATEPVAETTVPVETEPPTEAPTDPPPTEPDPVAERITEGVSVYIGDRECSAHLLDDDHYSTMYIQAGQELRLVSETPFGAIYLEWDKVPGVYTLNWEGGSLECGSEEFIHDYIRLPEDVTELTFVFTGEDAKKIANVAVFTDGTAPEGVQDWLAPCERADILVFPTHSDDDVLFFGPLIIHYAIEEELVVQTAFMVDHSGAQERKHERLNGLWEMGVRHYPILGNAPDTDSTDLGQSMSYYQRYDIPGWQVEQIRRFQPLVVVGHDLNGEYGNGGHKVNSYYLTQAIEWAADPEQFPESAQTYGTWQAAKLYLHCLMENGWMFEVNTPLTKDPQGRTAFEIAEDAFKFHKSQHRWSYYMTQDDTRLYRDCRPFGLYFTLVGYDTTADVMENIVVEEWRQD